MCLCDKWKKCRERRRETEIEEIERAFKSVAAIIIYTLHTNATLNKVKTSVNICAYHSGRDRVSEKETVDGNST